MTNIKDDIRAIVRLMRICPTQLLGSLRGREYQEIQDAVAGMIGDGEIILSSDRYLEIPVKLNAFGPTYYPTKVNL